MTADAYVDRYIELNRNMDRANIRMWAAIRAGDLRAQAVALCERAWIAMCFRDMFSGQEKMRYLAYMRADIKRAKAIADRL